MNTKITPQHNLMRPYTPGGFRNGTPASFTVQAEMPLTQTTRGQALAMYVVYDSGLQMVSDDPDACRDAAGFDFIRRVPTAWDETRFATGEPGRDIVLAIMRGARPSAFPCASCRPGATTPRCGKMATPQTTCGAGNSTSRQAMDSPYNCRQPVAPRSSWSGNNETSS